MVGIAQLVRAPGCGPGGQGFESLYSPHFVGFEIYGAQSKIFHSLLVGVSPSGKARDFDFRIRKFESCYPCHSRNFRLSEFYRLIGIPQYLGVSPSGKATDSDSVISKVRIFLPLPNTLYVAVQIIIEYNI